mgnify:CR=1 FL=1
MFDFSPLSISANTASGNIAGALAAKAMMADYNAKINQINSKLAKLPIVFINRNVHLAAQVRTTTFIFEIYCL